MKKLTGIVIGMTILVCLMTGPSVFAAMQVAAGVQHTVGLKADGTVVAVGNNESGKCNVASWNGIIQVAAGWEQTFGLKADRTVVAVGCSIDSDYGQCNVGGWTGIVQVATGIDHTVGVKADGTVVAVGYNGDGKCNVGGWTGIVQVDASYYHTIGLKADGTVVAVGYNAFGQCDVGGWTNIVQGAAGSDHTVGLKADGTVVAVGRNNYGQCDVFEWDLDGTPTLVSLSSFAAVPQSGRIIIQWTTASEIDNAGFNIYRAESKDGEYVKVNDSLIPAEGAPTQSVSYQFFDDGVKNRTTYYYKLEDMNLNGTSTMHGPVSGTLNGKYLDADR